MEIAILNSPSMTNMNEDDLFKMIKGQRSSKKGDHHEILSKELKAPLRKVGQEGPGKNF